MGRLTDEEKMKKMKELLEEYESWEAELIMDNRCWGPEGMNPYPTLTPELYEWILKLQIKRNELLGRFKEKYFCQKCKNNVDVVEKYYNTEHFTECSICAEPIQQNR